MVRQLPGGWGEAPAFLGGEDERVPRCCAGPRPPPREAAASGGPAFPALPAGCLLALAESEGLKTLPHPRLIYFYAHPL